MNRKVSLGAAITIAVLAVALAISATMMIAMRLFNSRVSDISQRQVMYNYLDEIDYAARQQYTIDEAKLRDVLAHGYLDGLDDPYAEYLTADEYQTVATELAGTHVGFGFQIIKTTEPNALVISYVEENSPAALAGLRMGDTLVSVNGTTVTGDSYTPVKGLIATEQELELKIRQNDTEAEVKLVSNAYTCVSVQGRIVQNSIGYIRIRSFNSGTAVQFKTKYAELERQGARSFVLDLRNNKGGSVDAAREVLGYLLPSGPYINCTTKNGVEAFSTSDPYEMTVSAVVLVNGGTTGEAELVAGVLQDLSKAKLVGVSTAGKAVVQEYFTLPSDKAAVKLTTGVLTRLKSETSWQDTGLIPDKMVDMPYSQLQRFEMLTDTEDDQLKAACELLKNDQPEETPSETTGTTVKSE